MPPNYQERQLGFQVLTVYQFVFACRWFAAQDTDIINKKHKMSAIQWANPNWDPFWPFLGSALLPIKAIFVSVLLLDI